MQLWFQALFGIFNARISMTLIRPTIWILLHAPPAPNHLTYQKYGTQTTLKSSPRGVQFYLKMNIY